MSRYTTVRLSHDLVIELCKLREYHRESYDSVITRLVSVCVSGDTVRGMD